MEMVDLVLQRTRQQFFTFNFEGVTLRVLCPHLDPTRSLHLLPYLRQAQATLFFILLTEPVRDDGINQHNLVVRVLAKAEINHCDLLRDPNLWRRQPNPLGGVHALEHVFDELAQLRPKLLHPRALTRQHRVRVLQHLVDAARCFQKRCHLPTPSREPTRVVRYFRRACIQF